MVVHVGSSVCTVLSIEADITNDGVLTCKNHSLPNLM